MNHFEQPSDIETSETTAEVLEKVDRARKLLAYLRETDPPSTVPEKKAYDESFFEYLKLNANLDPLNLALLKIPKESMDFERDFETTTEEKHSFMLKLVKHPPFNW